MEARMMIQADELTKTSYFRWSPDWKKATLLYEKAANGFMLAKKYQNAKIAFEKASEGQKILLSPWRAAKHMESAAVAAKELNNWIEVSKFYRNASELYKDSGKPDPAIEALASGAEALGNVSPDESVEMSYAALSIINETGPKGDAYFVYLSVTCIYLKHDRYREAASTLRDLGSLAAKDDTPYFHFEAYFGAMVIYLYVDDFKHGEDFEHAKTYYDILSKNEYMMVSSKGTWTTRLFSFYKEGDYDKMIRLMSPTTSPVPFPSIHDMIRPIVTALARKASNHEEAPLDENDNHDC